MKKAEVKYKELAVERHEELDLEGFKASRGWLQKFMKRNSLSFQRKTSVAQKDPDRLVAKIVSYILQVRRMQSKYHYQPCDIIAMDETPVWSDMVSE